MITVYWTAVIDGDVTELSADVEHPVAAAQIMSAVESAENLTPAGWSWDTTDDYDRVMTIRREREYGDAQASRRYPQDYCLRTFAAYGACLRLPGHEGLCRDATGHRFAPAPDVPPGVSTEDIGWLESGTH